jgi:hypothetical protein
MNKIEKRMQITASFFNITLLVRFYYKKPYALAWFINFWSFTCKDWHVAPFFIALYRFN